MDSSPAKKRGAKKDEEDGVRRSQRDHKSPVSYAERDDIEDDDVVIARKDDRKSSLAAPPAGYVIR